MVCPFLALLLITSVYSFKAHAYQEDCCKLLKNTNEKNEIEVVGSGKDIGSDRALSMRREGSQEESGWDRNARELEANKAETEGMEKQKKWWEKLEQYKLGRQKRAATTQMVTLKYPISFEDIFGESDEMAPNAKEIFWAERDGKAQYKPLYKTREQYEEDERKEKLERLERSKGKTKELTDEEKGPFIKSQEMIWSDDDEEPNVHSSNEELDLEQDDEETPPHQFHNKWNQKKKWTPKKKWRPPHQTWDDESEEATHYPSHDVRMFSEKSEEERANVPYDPLGIWTREDIEGTEHPVQSPDFKVRPFRSDVRTEKYAHRTREQKQKEREDELKRKQALVQLFRDRVKEVKEKMKLYTKKPLRLKDESTTLSVDMLEEIKDRNETIEMMRKKMRELWKIKGLGGTESNKFKGRSYLMRDYWHTEKEGSSTRGEDIKRLIRIVNYLWKYI
uniref:Uncharacterized protein n=1 Tax=Cacopsylla melanoneura TaxID=428564 RepID=A0A8D8R4J1_9HEMI